MTTCVDDGSLCRSAAHGLGSIRFPKQFFPTTTRLCPDLDQHGGRDDHQKNRGGGRCGSSADSAEPEGPLALALRAKACNVRLVFHGDRERTSLEFERQLAPVLQQIPMRA